jgi:ornithine cyclodeaminase
MSGSVLFLSAAEVERALTMPAAIAAVREAFIELSTGNADVPLRTPVPLPGDGTALFMPVHLPNQGRLGLKVATVVPDNPARGLPTTQALVVVFDAKTGRTEAVMDGEVLTAVRTGAASGVAADTADGRRGDSEVTIFKSVGNTVQDLAVAGVMPSQARRLDLGTEVEL